MKILEFNPALAADQEFSIQDSDGRPLTLRVFWIGRGASWYLDARYQPSVDAPESTLLGIKIVPRWLLLRENKALFPFPGDLLLLPTATEYLAQDPGYEDLGSKWKLCLLTAAEADSWKVKNGLS